MSKPNAPIDTHDDGHDHEAMMLEALRERGYRVTQPRRKIAAALSSAASPKSAKQIGARTRIKDASTVYRTLAELVKEGLVEEFTDRGISYFEIAHEHHDHAVCDSCGTMEHIPCESSKPPRTLARKGWVIHSHEALYRGMCARCAVV